MAKRIPTQEWIERFQQIHGNRYDYSKTKCRRIYDTIIIICKIHGEFSQTPGAHVRAKHGCNICANIAIADFYTCSIKEFVTKAKRVHGNKYNYSKSTYQHSRSKIVIVCSKHGEFSQTPNNHLRGRGCPVCSCNISKLEEDWITSLKIPNLRRSPRIYLKNGKYYKPDGYDPKTNTVYEFFGDFYHGNINCDRFHSTDIHPKNKKTFGELYNETMDKIATYKTNGYKIVYVWENDFIKNLNEL